MLSDTYLLGDILARGGMGVLYAAEHTRLRTPLVVKVRIVSDSTLMLNGDAVFRRSEPPDATL